ncbi:MAG: DUF973 family protein [Thermoplasmatales archaeon]|nr:DUF973 family protein [Thermoplasmatales archaeon]MCW6170458.1 DUF973 family protein [Thermoplasmatales archaeon]
MSESEETLLDSTVCEDELSRLRKASALMVVLTLMAYLNFVLKLLAVDVIVIVLGILAFIFLFRTFSGLGYISERYSIGNMGVILEILGVLLAFSGYFSLLNRSFYGLFLAIPGLVIAIIGLILVAVGIHRLGAGLDSSSLKTGAYLTVIPFLNIIGWIVVLIGSY